LLGGLSSLLVVGCAPPKQTTAVKRAQVAPAPVVSAQASDGSAAKGKQEEAPVAAAPGGNEVVASINNEPITMSQLMAPMLDAAGLSTLMNIVKLDLARQNATARGVTISEDDVAYERDSTLAQLLPDAEKKDYNALLEQFLDRQRLSHQEFDMLVRTRAYLRKMAEPIIKSKITDADVQEAFNTLYGETVKARFIQCSNLQEIGEAQRRLRAGEPFEQVARELSRSPQTRELGGELPVFSRQTPGLPDVFKETAFSLKEDEVSDPVQAENSYYLIKVEKRMAPKAVKFEDVKDAVRKDLIERMTEQTQKELTNNLAQQALLSLKIENPVLKKQFEQKLNRRDATIKDREEFRKELEKSRPATAPAAEQTK
jgi:foldase protein PrsA